MDKSLQMIFENASGSNVTITIPAIKDEILESDVKSLMTLIITKNIFQPKGGELKGIVGANIVSRDVQKLTVR